MQWLIGFIIFVGVLAKAYFTGRKTAQADIDSKKNEVLNEILEEAVKPVTVDDAVSKLRSGDF